MQRPHVKAKGARTHPFVRTKSVIKRAKVLLSQQREVLLMALVTDAARRGNPNKAHLPTVAAHTPPLNPPSRNILRMVQKQPRAVGPGDLKSPPRAH